MLTVFLRITGESRYADVALRLVRHVMDRHVNLARRFPELHEWDLVISEGRISDNAVRLHKALRGGWKSMG